MMEPLSNPPTQKPLKPNPPSRNPDRRTFLRSLATVGAGAGIATKALAFTSDRQSESVYRIRTPECEVRMSVEYFGNSEISTLRFRDSLTQRPFCLSASGEPDPGCAARFSGSMAIAHYRFRSRSHGQPPLRLRERVLTIDHDSRIDPRPPFERLLAVQRETVSDIQAFGYTPDNPQPSAPGDKPLALWCLVRQDLFLNEQPTAFLVVHWKHTFDAIHLLDVIPGDRTELINA
jgi:hypothetical protein